MPFSLGRGLSHTHFQEANRPLRRGDCEGPLPQLSGQRTDNLHGKMKLTKLDLVIVT